MKPLIVATLLLGLAAGAGVSADKHAYTGATKCKICHSGEKNAMVFEKWQASPHAKAYEVLAGESAKAVYAKLGKSGDPQADPACLKCHVTGYGLDSALVAKVVATEGVTCEACHGAGGDYWKKNVMENRDLALAAGLNPDPKAACVTCHNDKSPTFKGFKFEEAWKKIEHHLPPKPAAPQGG